MSYDAWRISYQSSEQAAQAAYKAWQQAREERDAQQQRTGIINACNHLLSMRSDTHKAFFATGRYVYVSTRALREYADTLTEQPEATPCPPR